VDSPLSLASQCTLVLKALETEISVAWEGLFYTLFSIFNTETTTNRLFFIVVY